MDSEPETDCVPLFGSLSSRARLWVILRDELYGNYRVRVCLAGL